MKRQLKVKEKIRILTWKYDNGKLMNKFDFYTRVYKNMFCCSLNHKHRTLPMQYRT